jgi:SAM-dependent methyltransferase
MDLLPNENAAYGTQEYWVERYKEDKGLYDWFGKYDGSLKAKLSELIKRNTKILHLGCGNSELGPDMFLDGYHNICNLDYAANVIKLQKERFEHLEWTVGDIFQLDESLQDRVFDVALDKGTLDALLTAKHDPWDPEPEIIEYITAYMNEVARHLKSGGRFIHITFVQSHFRKRFLEVPAFHSVEVHTLSSQSGGFEYFVYVARKA